MACFIVPAAEAVVVTVAEKVVTKHEDARESTAPARKYPMSKKLAWLNYMLWGGTGVLFLDHLYSGELTAMVSMTDFTPLLHEIATVGVALAATVTAAWGAICAVADRRLARNVEKTVESEA